MQRLRLLDEALAHIHAPLYQVPPCDPTAPADRSWRWHWRAQQAAGGLSALHGIGKLVAVDIGVGDSPTTTVEMAARLRCKCAGGGGGGGQQAVVCAAVIGTEADKGRLQTAVEYELPPGITVPPLDFRLGTTDFSLPLQPDERPVLIRAMNVLRDYHTRDAASGLRLMHASLTPGGMLVEGSSDSPGDLLVALLLWKDTAAEAEQRAVGPGKADCRVGAAIFAVDLSVVDQTPELFAKPVTEWFERHLPRIWLGCVGEKVRATAWGGGVHGGAHGGAHGDDGRERRDGGGAVVGNEKARKVAPWQEPVVAFLQAWAAVDDGAGSPGERFVRSARSLAAGDGCYPGGGGRVVGCWAEKGWVVWVPDARLAIC